MQALGPTFYVNLAFFSLAHVAVLLVANLPMMLIYRAKHPFFEQFRSEPNQPFPWEEDSQRWVSLRRRNLVLLFVNILLLAPFMAVLTVPDIKHPPYRYDLESWPSLWEMAGQIILFSFIEDFCFYWSHRTLHTSWCYRHVHKRHHEYRQPVMLGSEFAHPLEYLFGNLLPFTAGPLLLDTRMHAVTFLVWSIYRVSESADAHCGYEFPWSPFRLIPFSGRPPLT